MKVTALLVSHNGARWLPAVLAGLTSSTRRPDRIVAVDTGSSDDSVTLLTESLGTGVTALPATTPYAEAVSAGLEQAGPAEPDEWVWLLHDDANPAPDCLERLAQAAQQAGPAVAVVGPKIREWPSLKRLLEVGVTLSGTGRRETGLERGEYDQGQHDQQHQVLAVNTAGMLVRRDVLEQVGLDPVLEVFGTDLDFGWRVARAGYATQVVPDAVLFHVEAARRGLRDSALVDHPQRQGRSAAWFTLLANSPGWTIPFRVVRMLLGGLLRALGLLLVRAPGEAADEVLAVAGTLAHPRRILAARRDRRTRHQVPHQQVRPLLAPFWVPYRHGLDFLGDVAAAVVDTVREAAERRRGGPALDLPWWRRALRHRGSMLLVVAVVLALYVGHGWVGGGALHGGALLPAPDGVGHWWSTWSAGWHSLGTGTDAPGPAYLLPLALVGTLLLGHPGLVVTALFVLAVPLSAAGAVHFTRRLTGSPWAPLWAGATYALLPVVGGGLQQGRLGTVAGAAILPWVAAAALRMCTSGPAGPSGESARWRSTWRVALGLGLLTAFVPTAWLLALLLVFLGLFTRWGRDHGRHLLVVLLLPLVTVLPWALATDRVPGAWLVEAGKVASVPAHPGVLDLLLGRAGGPFAAPAWLGLGLVVAAVLALVRADTRPRVTRAWVVAAAASVLVALISRTTVTLPGVPVDVRAWSGFLVLVVQAALVAAVAVASSGVTAMFAGASFSWRQPVAVVALVGGLLTPLLGAGWWVLHGDEGPLDRNPPGRLPVYMTDLSHGTDQGGVLVLTGGPVHGISYQLLRSGPLRLGDDAVLALAEPDGRLGPLIESVLASGGDRDAATLASYGVHYVFAPAPVNERVSGGLDASAGFAGASAPKLGSRAWRVEPTPSVDGLDHARADWRPLWLTLQVLAIVAGIVLALPERLVEGRRR